jgi:hypothetical protein
MEDYYRTCRYKNENYIFHCFEQWSNVIGESIVIGGHPGGQVSGVFALIENEKGNIFRVDPTAIVFTDNEFEEIFKNCEVAEHESK